MPQYLETIADLLMVVASVGAASYCLILSKRLSRLTSFDKGIGGAIAVLSAQVDDMKSALTAAKTGSEGAGKHLEGLVAQARDISNELELMIAACHDFAEEALVVQTPAANTADNDPQGSTDTQPEGPLVLEAPSLINTPPPADEVDAANEATEANNTVPMFGSRRGQTEPMQAVFRHQGRANP